jgi:transposase
MSPNRRWLISDYESGRRCMTRASAACRRLMTIPGVGKLTALAFVAAIRRSVAHPSIAGRPRLFRLGPQAVSVWRGRLHRRHLEMRRPAGANPAVRGRHGHADPLKGQLKLKERAFAIAKRSTMRKARVALARRRAMLRDGTKFAPAQAVSRPISRIELPQGATPEGRSRRRRGLCCRSQLLADWAFNLALPK